MNAASRSNAAATVTFLAALLALFGGFGLLRVSAATESYGLLFLSFGLMFWGLLALFTGHGKPWGG